MLSSRENNWWKEGIEGFEDLPGEIHTLNPSRNCVKDTVEGVRIQGEQDVQERW